MQRLMALFAMLMLVVMTGCAGKQHMQQVGGSAVSWTTFDVEFMHDTPKIQPLQCPISQLKDYRYLVEQSWPWYRADKWFSKEKPSQFFQACPDPRMKMDLHLESWDPIELKWQDSVFRVVGPGVANMFGFAAGGATLGATMPRSTTNVSQVVPIDASTVYTNAVTVPAWIGKH